MSPSPAQALSLLDEITAHALSNVAALPVFNDVALRVRGIIQKEESTVEQVERLIQSDQALATAVLRAANSSFYGGLQPSRTIKSAISRIGFIQLSQIVFFVTEKARYDVKTSSLAAAASTLWRHASSTAVGAQWLAQRLRLYTYSDEAFLGGLIHDIGKLAILASIDAISAARSLELPAAVVNEILESAHTTVGSRLLEEWNLPDVYRSVVAEHHAENVDPAQVTLNLVRLADQAARKVGLSSTPDPSLVLGASAEALALGASEVLLAELEVLLEDWGRTLETM